MAGTRTTVDEICFQLSQCLTDVETTVVGSQTATTALRLRKIVDRRCESALKAPDNGMFQLLPPKITDLR
jgi:hypothetical protein